MCVCTCVRIGNIHKNQYCVDTHTHIGVLHYELRDNVRDTNTECSTEAWFQLSSIKLNSTVIDKHVTFPIDFVHGLILMHNRTTIICVMLCILMNLITKNFVYVNSNGLMNWTVNWVWTVVLKLFSLNKFVQLKNSRDEKMCCSIYTNRP